MALAETSVALDATVYEVWRWNLAAPKQEVNVFLHGLGCAFVTYDLDFSSS